MYAFDVGAKPVSAHPLLEGLPLMLTQTLMAMWRVLIHRGFKCRRPLTFSKSLGALIVIVFYFCIILADIDREP